VTSFFFVVVVVDDTFDDTVDAKVDDVKLVEFDSITFFVVVFCRISVDVVAVTAAAVVVAAADDDDNDERGVIVFVSVYFGVTLFPLVVHHTSECQKQHNIHSTSN